MANVMAYPNVGRGGLGNMLFPWARAEVFRHRHNVPMLAPAWVKPRIGPMLRGESDKRLYAGLFSNRGYVRGIRRGLALWRGKRVKEIDAEALMRGPGSASGSGGGTTLVEFDGYNRWFEGDGPHQRLVPHRDLVCRRLREILTPRVRKILDASPPSMEIAVHVRRGGDRRPMDFMEQYPGEIDGVPQHSKTMPDQWFINIIRGVREAIGAEAEVTVFSDATDQQIGSILALPKMRRAPANPSIVDILLLARARVLITSGTSSFSAWAAYVGGMPAVWYPGLCLELVPGRPDLGIESTLSGELPAAGARTIAEAFRAGAGR